MSNRNHKVGSDKGKKPKDTPPKPLRYVRTIDPSTAWCVCKLPGFDANHPDRCPTCGKRADWSKETIIKE